MGASQVSGRQEGEIIIKCHIDEIVKQLCKSYQVVWCDPNVNAEENKEFIDELKTICDLKTFSDYIEAFSYLQTHLPLCQVITSDTHGELIVKEISQLECVSSVYVFCQNVDYDSAWAQKFPKVNCVEKIFGNLLSQIQRTKANWQKISSSWINDLPHFASLFDDVDTSDAYYRHLYQQGLTNFRDRELAKEDFIELARTFCWHDEDLTRFGRKYTEYNMKDILKWFSKPSFSRILSRCMRTATFDTIQYCRLPIRDIENAVKEKHKSSKDYGKGLVLYSDIHLTDKEWVKFKHNIDKDIEALSFFPASSSRELVLKSIIEDSKKILVTIIVPGTPKLDDQSFARIVEESNSSSKEEFIFNLRSRFRIIYAGVEVFSGSARRHLVLLFGAHGLCKSITETKPSIEISIANVPSKCYVCNTPLRMTQDMFVYINLILKNQIICSECVEVFQQKVKAPLLCLLSLSLPEYTFKNENIKISGRPLEYKYAINVPLYSSTCTECQRSTHLNTLYRCIDCRDDLNKCWCAACFNTNNHCVKSGHLLLAESAGFTFWRQGLSREERICLKYRSQEFGGQPKALDQFDVLLKAHEYDKLIELFNKYVEQNPTEEMVMMYRRAGLAYDQLAKHKEAFECYLKVLEVLRSLSDKDSLDLAVCHNDLGESRRLLMKYDEAIDIYQNAINIYSKLRSPDLKLVAITEERLGLTYIQLQEAEKARKFYKLALKDFGENFEDLNIDMLDSFDNLGWLIQQTQPIKALEHHNKVFEVYRLVYGEKHPKTAKSYKNLALLYMQLDEDERAKEYCLKALEIFELFYKPSHPLVQLMQEDWLLISS